jgi:hypothetical protein
MSDQEAVNLEPYLQSSGKLSLMPSSVSFIFTDGRNDMNDEQLLESLREKLSLYEAERAKAEALLARLPPLIEHVKALIDALEAERHQGLLAMPTLPEPPHSEDGMETADRSRMPPCRPEYRDMTAIVALTRVLDHHGRPMHADELTHAVFEIQTRDDFDVAKRAAVSELVRGANRGFVQKLGGNVFASKNYQRTTDEGHPLPQAEPQQQLEEQPASEDTDFMPEASL